MKRKILCFSLLLFVLLGFTAVVAEDQFTKDISAFREVYIQASDGDKRAVRKALKAVIKSETASEDEKWEAQRALQKLPRDANPVRQQRRCRQYDGRVFPGRLRLRHRHGCYYGDKGFRKNVIC